MNLFNSVPTQACQRGDILNRGNVAQVNNKAFQGTRVMLFGVGKVKPRLLDGSAVFAVKPWDFDDQLNLSAPNRRHLERTFVSAKPDDIAGFAVRTLQIIGVNRAVKDGLAVKKSVFLYCTAGTPKV